eukprot:290352_1
MLRTILALKYQSLRARRLYLYSPWHRCTFSSKPAVKTVRVVPEKRTADEIIDIQTTTRAVINGDTQTARSPIPSPKSFLNAAKVGHTQTVSTNSEPLVSETVSTNSEPRVSQTVSAKSDISVSQGRSDIGLEIVGKSQSTIANNVEAEEPSQLNNCSDQAVSQSTSPAESHQSTIQDKTPAISDISSSEDPNTEIRVLNDTTPLDSSPTVTVEPQVSQNTGCCEPSVLSFKEVPLVSQNNKSQSISPQSEHSSQIYASQNQSHSTDISPECNSTLASQSTSKIYKYELSKSNASQSQPSQSNVSQSQKSKSISSQSELSSQTEAPGIQSSQSEAPGIQPSQSELPGIQQSPSEASGIQPSQSEAHGIQKSQSHSRTDKLPESQSPSPSPPSFSKLTPPVDVQRENRETAQIEKELKIATTPKHVLRVVKRHHTEFEPGHITEALQKLSHASPGQIDKLRSSPELRTLYSLIPRHISSFSVDGNMVLHSLVALVKLQCVNTDVLRCLALKSHDCIPLYKNARSLAILPWALAKLHFRDEQCCRLVECTLVRNKFEGLSPKDLGILAGAFGQMKFKPGGEFLEGFAEAVRPCLQAFKSPSEITNVMSSLSTLRVDAPDLFQFCISRLNLDGLKGLKIDDLVRCICSLSSVQYQPTDQFLRDWMSATTVHVTELTLPQLHQIAAAMNVLGVVPSWPFGQGLISHTECLLPVLTDKERQDLVSKMNAIGLKPRIRKESASSPSSRATGSGIDEVVEKISRSILKRSLLSRQAGKRTKAVPDQDKSSSTSSVLHPSRKFSRPLSPIALENPKTVSASKPIQRPTYKPKTFKTRFTASSSSIPKTSKTPEKFKSRSDSVSRSVLTSNARTTNSPRITAQTVPTNKTAVIFKSSGSLEPSELRPVEIKCSELGTRAKFQGASMADNPRVSALKFAATRESDDMERIRRKSAAATKLSSKLNKPKARSVKFVPPPKLEDVVKKPFPKTQIMSPSKRDSDSANQTSRSEQFNPPSVASPLKFGQPTDISRAKFSQQKHASPQNPRQLWKLHMDNVDMSVSRKKITKMLTLSRPPLKIEIHQGKSGYSQNVVALYDNREDPSIVGAGLQQLEIAKRKVYVRWMPVTENTESSISAATDNSLNPATNKTRSMDHIDSITLQNGDTIDISGGNFDGHKSVKVHNGPMPLNRRVDLISKLSRDLSCPKGTFRGELGKYFQVHFETNSDAASFIDKVDGYEFEGKELRVMLATVQSVGLRGRLVFDINSTVLISNLPEREYYKPLIKLALRRANKITYALPIQKNYGNTSSVHGLLVSFENHRFASDFVKNLKGSSIGSYKIDADFVLNKARFLISAEKIKSLHVLRNILEHKSSVAKNPELAVDSCYNMSVAELCKLGKRLGAESNVLSDIPVTGASSLRQAVLKNLGSFPKYGRELLDLYGKIVEFGMVNDEFNKEIVEHVCHTAADIHPKAFMKFMIHFAEAGYLTPKSMQTFNPILVKYLKSDSGTQISDRSVFKFLGAAENVQLSPEFRQLFIRNFPKIDRDTSHTLYREILDAVVVGRIHDSKIAGDLLSYYKIQDKSTQSLKQLLDLKTQLGFVRYCLDSRLEMTEKSLEFIFHRLSHNENQSWSIDSCLNIGRIVCKLPQAPSKNLSKKWVYCFRGFLTFEIDPAAFNEMLGLLPVMRGSLAITNYMLRDIESGAVRVIRSCKIEDILSVFNALADQNMRPSKSIISEMHKRVLEQPAEFQASLRIHTVVTTLGNMDRVHTTLAQDTPVQSDKTGKSMRLTVYGQLVDFLYAQTIKHPHSFDAQSSADISMLCASLSPSLQPAGNLLTKLGTNLVRHSTEKIELENLVKLVWSNIIFDYTTLYHTRRFQTRLFVNINEHTTEENLKNLSPKYLCMLYEIFHTLGLAVDPSAAEKPSRIRRLLDMANPKIQPPGRFQVANDLRVAVATSFASQQQLGCSFSDKMQRAVKSDFSLRTPRVEMVTNQNGLESGYLYAVMFPNKKVLVTLSPPAPSQS